MNMVHVVLWKWEPAFGVRRSYSAYHVNQLALAVKMHTEGMDVPVRVICVTDDPTGITECPTYPLWSDCSKIANATKQHLPSCYRRLKLYDRQTQRDLDISLGDRIVGLDLDVLITGNLREVLMKRGIYVGWKLVGPVHNEVYNGSFQMFTAGSLTEIWSEFDPKRSPYEASAAGWRGSDQSWLSMKLIGREGCTSIDYPTFASHPLHIKRLGAFSARTRIVFFHGNMKPWSPEAVVESKWIRRYWRPEHDLPERPTA